ncbi:MAG TPA: RHS repeat-associated core domain-containing protein [Gemmataceae bacterium]|nr:RHS repeat-associated core domain-containing protein [Gemmataceae bacterium]
MLNAVVPAQTEPAVYPIATQTVYRNADGTGAETTSYSYTWFAGSTRMQSQTMSRPVVSADQNGPGIADTQSTVYDVDGRPIWQRDGDGFLTYTAYDPSTSAVVEQIVDVDTSRSGDFQDLPAGWTTPAGGGRHLITRYEVDRFGRTTAMTEPNGNITYTVYNDPAHEMRTYPGWQAGTNLPTGPTQVIREDRDHSPSYTEVLTMSAVPHVDPAGRPDGTEPISDVQSLSRSFTSPGSQVVETDRYFSLSGQTYSTDPYLGIAGTNYNATFYAYDERGRLDRTVSPTGTINRAIYDGLGRMVSTWVGTDDTPASGYWSPENNTAPSNMVEVSAMVYDNGGVGDGNLTEQTRFPGGGAAPRVTQDFYDWRDRRVASKQGVQDVEANGTHRPIWYTVYDNLDKTLSQGEYDGDGVSITVSNGVPDRPPANRLRALTTNQYDDQGRLFQTNMFSVDPNDGTVSLASLTTSSWYDHRGNVIKRVSPGGLVTKNQYDGAGMLVATYQTDGQGDATWADAGSVANNNVLSQTETQYDADNNPILVIARQRFHDETAAGALGDPTNSPKARVSYVASYYDPANRLTDQVDVGTNGGMAYTRPDAPPAGSDTVLVTHTDYDPAGRIQDVVDPRGLVTQTTYDLLGRTVETIEGYSGDGTPTDSTNRTTVYTYDGADHVLTQTAVLPNNQTQTTQYVYGVTGLISSNDLLAAVIYADNGLPNTQTYTYDALGEALTKTDRNGSTHTYSYDVLGRQIADAVTTLGSGVDGTILRLETAYDSAGRPYLYTSYDAASGGNIVNQVMQIYNGLGQLVRQYQAHTGPVDPASTPAVQYAYSEMAGGANHSRLISMTYPNGREIDYTYAAGVDDAIGRLTSISDSTGILESYRYLGLSTIVVRSHPQSGVDLTYLQQPGQPTGDAGDQYTGLDRFGRVVDQLWLNTNTGTATDEFAYGYDADGNPLYRQNVVNPAFDELYHANGSGNGYDNFNQLTAFARGALDPSNNSITNPSHSQAWTLDALGNWQTVTTDGIDQNRTFDAQNQITSIGGLATPGYDNNGNTVTDQNDNTLVYDAWNRLIRVEDSDGRPLSTYTYDALGRRITETSTATMDLYFSKDWQVVEEQSGGEMQTQYVWSPAYEDAMVERDTSDGTRLYVQQDANWNVTAVVDATGTVQERYVYDPYGQVSFLAPDWSARSSSSVNWIYLHQGGRFDTVSGLYNFRNRDFSPVLGRWLQQDPMAFAAGDNNLYGCLAENPLGADDPLGLKPCCKETHIDGTYWNAVVMFEMNLLMKHIFAEGSYVPRGVGWARVPPTGQDPYPDWSSHGYLAASGFDSPFWGSSVKKDAFIFDDGPLKGHVLKGYETNYYFQGMIARAYGVSLPGLYAMMFLWKGWNMYVMKMPDYQWPSEGELFAATAGYRNFTKDYIEWANAVKAGKEIKNPGVPCI